MSHDVSLCLFPRVRFYDGNIGNWMTFFLFGPYFTQRFCNLFGSGTLSQKSVQGGVCPRVCCMGGVRFLVSMMLRLRYEPHRRALSQVRRSHFGSFPSIKH